MRRYVCLAVILFAGMLGCEQPEQKQVEHPRNSQEREALEAAHRKIQDLSAQLEHLRADNQRLRAKNAVLAAQSEIMSPRLQQVIALYGTGIWECDMDSTAPEFVKSMKGAGVRDVAAELNERFRKEKQPNIRIARQEGGTVVVRVDNEEQLGEQMGSSGALSYMTEVIYSLVSVRDVDCVFFDIGDREHASPGKYCKDSLEPLAPQ